MRVRLNQGTRAPSSALYLGNMITFVGVATAGITAEGGLILIGGTSEITHAALVIAPDWDDNTQDFVFAIHAPDAVFTVPANSAAALRWQHQFA